MLERAPQPATTRAVARATVSPAALGLGAGGAAIALLASLPLAPVVLLGVAGWAGGVAISAARSRRRPRLERVDPFAVPEPWRGYVQAAVVAQRKFEDAVAHTSPGPIRDRLRTISARLAGSVQECWRIAHHGAALDAALHSLDAASVSHQLQQVQAERHRLLAGTEAEGQAGRPAPAVGPDTGAAVPPRPPPSSLEALGRSEEALATQLQTARRVEAVARRASDQLRVLTAKLDGAVAGAVEVALQASGTAAAGQLAGRLDAILAELESLRLALEETDTAEPPPSP